MNFLNDLTTRALHGGLTGLEQRQSAISSNIANIDTPGYSPVAVSFEERLAAALDSARAGTNSAGATPPQPGPSAANGLRRTNPRHIDPGSPDGADPFGSSTSDFVGSTRNDGNKVDLESEVTALAETQLRYSGVSRLMAGHLGQIRDVIGSK